MLVPAISFLIQVMRDDVQGRLERDDQELNLLIGLSTNIPSQLGYIRSVKCCINLPSAHPLADQKVTHLVENKEWSRMETVDSEK